MAEKREDRGKEVDRYVDDLIKAADVPKEERYNIKDKSGYYPMPEGYWNTAVSQSAPYKIFIRGYPLYDIIGNLTFTEVLHLTLMGELPSEDERKILDTLLCCIVDHQMVAANIPAARYTASGNPQFIPALASGILTIGANTVSPFDSSELIEASYKLMKNENLSFEETAKKIIAEYRAKKKRIPGFGHPSHREWDPRTVKLFYVAHKMGILKEKTRLYFAIHDEFSKTFGKGKGIPINIDGAMACVFSELGWGGPLISLAVATMSFLPGMMAQIIEELENPVPLRYIHKSDYIGVPPRPLPEELKKEDLSKPPKNRYDVISTTFQMERFTAGRQI